MSAASCEIDAPREIAGSPLLASGGFRISAHLVCADDLQRLIEEAGLSRPSGRRNVLEITQGNEERGGAPARAFNSAPGGAAQWAIFSSPQMLVSLRAICGVEVAPLGAGTYSYYEQTGDFLALHRDIVGCEVSVITCLEISEGNRMHGGLVLYPNHVGVPLARIPKGLIGGPQALTLGRGETVILLGGIVPHEVTPMRCGQERIVSVMCYRWMASQSHPG